MGVATCYINIFIASILDHACTAFFIHTLYTDVVLYAQQKTIDRDVELLAKNIGYEQLQRLQFRERCTPAPALASYGRFFQSARRHFKNAD